MGSKGVNARNMSIDPAESEGLDARQCSAVHNGQIAIPLRVLIIYEFRSTFQPCMALFNEPVECTFVC
jgi:hypothetical protein